MMRVVFGLLILPLRALRWLLVLLALIPAAIAGLVILSIIAYLMTQGG